MHARRPWGLIRVLAAGLAASLTACGGNPPVAPSGPPPATTAIVQSVTDGDTIRLTQAVLGATSVRLLNIDTAELNAPTQEPWATDARTSLSQLIPAGSTVALETDRTVLDTFGRLLAHVLRPSDSLNVNVEQVRRGHAVMYVIWPNVNRFEEYRGAQIEARGAGRGVWAPGQTLTELPFEYRRRTDGTSLFRPTGDFVTKFFVDPTAYALVGIENRVFFSGNAEALSGGYRSCPVQSGTYDSVCFAR